MSLNKLVTASRRYGANEEYVLAGGGNTSWKTDKFMYVKASGNELATIGEEGFVKIGLPALEKIWSKKYADDAEKREEEVLADLMASRYESEKNKRPSVETLLHALFPNSFVVHTHPALVNGVTCSQNGEETIKKLFGDKAIWIPIINPGYMLAKEVKDTIEKNFRKGNKLPTMVFLQNHGVFVAGNSIDQIDNTYRHIFDTIGDCINKFPATTELPIDEKDVEIGKRSIKEALAKDVKILAFSNRDIEEMSLSEEAFAPLKLSITPDHIVYYGFKPLYAHSLRSLKQDMADYVKENATNPRLAVVK